MRLASLLVSVLAFTLGACGTDKKTSGGGSASSASYYSVSGNVCLLVTPAIPFTAAQLESFNEGAEAGSELKAGVCPMTVTIGSQKASVLKNCDAKDEELSPGITVETQATVYNKQEADGQVVTVTASQATEICTQIAEGSGN